MKGKQQQDYRVEKYIRYGIRKYSFGAASVAVAAGLMFLGNGAVSATEVQGTEASVAATTAPANQADSNKDKETVKPETKVEEAKPEVKVQEAKKVNKDLDLLVKEDESYSYLVKSVVVDIVARTLMTSTNQEPMTQYSESALGYSVSGSFLVPGGGLFIKDSELKRLGFKKQRYGVIEFYDYT